MPEQHEHLFDSTWARWQLFGQLSFEDTAKGSAGTVTQMNAMPPLFTRAMAKPSVMMPRVAAAAAVCKADRSEVGYSHQLLGVSGMAWCRLPLGRHCSL
jgi:hypothetical protein